MKSVRAVLPIFGVLFSLTVLFPLRRAVRQTDYSTRGLRILLTDTAIPFFPYHPYTQQGCLPP